VIKRTTTTRGFQLIVHAVERMDGRYVVTVRETNGARDNARKVARLPAERLDAGHGPLADALRASKQAGTALKGTRRTPVLLAEDAGVRVALALNVISGVTKPGRTSRLLDGISRLSDEECFYWYAQTVGARDDATRRRRFKALRIFLAEE
jgi:hypothetical protein